jgi:hypothetical protein
MKDKISFDREVFFFDRAFNGPDARAWCDAVNYSTRDVINCRNTYNSAAERVSRLETDQSLSARYVFAEFKTKTHRNPGLNAIHH